MNATSLEREHREHTKAMGTGMLKKAQVLSFAETVRREFPNGKILSIAPIAVQGRNRLLELCNARQAISSRTFSI